MNIRMYGAAALLGALTLFLMSYDAVSAASRKHHVFTAKDVPAVLPNTMDGNDPFEVEAFIRSLDGEGMPPVRENIPAYSEAQIPDGMDGKPWAGMAVDNNGKTFSAWNKLEMEDALFSVSLTCRKRSTLKDTCNAAIQQGWIVAVYCRGNGTMRGIVEAGWTAKAAIAYAFQKALEDDYHEKRHCKMVAVISASGMHTKYALSSE